MACSIIRCLKTVFKYLSYRYKLRFIIFYIALVTAQYVVGWSQVSFTYIDNLYSCIIVSALGNIQA